VSIYWGVLVRHRLLILGCTLLVAAAVGVYTYRQTPLFSASASLRIQNRQPNLPDIYRDVSVGGSGSEMATELQVLGSRALKEAAARELALQVRLVEPARVSRDQLLANIQVPAESLVAEYRLSRGADGRFAVFAEDSSKPITVSDSNRRVQLPGLSFDLTPAAVKYDQLVVDVSSLAEAVEALSGATVEQPSRDADILTLSYSDPDSLIARRVPNSITAQYVARRKDLEHSEAASTAKFLREQLQRVSSELAGAEEEFRGYKERNQVLDPEVQTSSEVNRLITKEAERSALEAERQALQRSLAEIDSAGTQPGSPPSYRQLIGLPFLLRNEAASALLTALVSAENELAGHVSAKAADPDVRELTAKITALQDQLRTITQTYLQGLSNQVAALDSTLGSFGRELRAIPGKQLTYARLDRNVKSLVAVYDLLESRLKEAEIAAAVEDASVQVVDSAVTPLAPSSPQPLINLAAGLGVGLMLGVGMACIREYRDRSVHSRQDVLLATGVPVLGLIPRLPKSRGRVPLIAARQRKKSLPPPGADPGKRRPNGRDNYTFLGSVPVGAPEDDHGHVLRRDDVGSPVELSISQWTNALAEAYSLLLTSITFARSAPPSKSVVITSPLAGDGKTTCAVNLAITLALRGSRPLLMDVDLRRGVIHSALGGERSPGVSEILSNKVSFEEAVRTVKVGEHGTLHYLATGSIPANPTALLQSSELPTLLARLTAEYDMVVIDSPPANIISDATVLGLNADVVLVVARAGMTDSAALTFAAEQLTRLGVPLFGVVLNDIDFQKDSVYDPTYRSYGASDYLRTTDGT